MEMQIGFNKPALLGNEFDYIKQAIVNEKLSGGGAFTKKCQEFLTNHIGGGKSLLTTSCTDALEMAAILCNIEPGDEIILPSFTFVSTANAFALRGAELVFVDSRPDHPGMDESQLESVITSHTKAIVPVHYAGVACDMDLIMDLSRRHDLFVIEDAAQAIGSKYGSCDGTFKQLGGIGDIGTFSFHETKNIHCGEGGAILLNNERFNERAEIIWEKGTNRSKFWRGEIDKYGWVDIGSSFLPSELNAAFLLAQLEEITKIQSKRAKIWSQYWDGLNSLFMNGKVSGPHIPAHATNNAHMFYLVTKSLSERDKLIAFLKSKGIQAVFHYQSLHRSAYFQDRYKGPELRWSDTYAECLVRLPLYYELNDQQVEHVISQVNEFYDSRN